MLIEKVCTDLNSKYDDFILPSEVRLVQDLVKGDSSRFAHAERAFLFDIVANKSNSFDLDKLDYLNRDTIHTQINKSKI
jgi:HD superfamily phosphohydrolase